jgi:glucose-6-phosphate 1-dehydrogenase
MACRVGVPIYIRAGKALPVTAVEVMTYFKRPPRETFEETVSHQDARDWPRKSHHHQRS